MYLSLKDSGLTLEAIAKFTKGTVSSGDPSLTAHDISIDSRTVQPGDAFVAIVGDRFDGHDYVSVAAEKGAIFAVVSRVPDSCPIPCVVVPDTRAALGDIARGYKQFFRAFSVAVTGSVGKTTTKQFIYSVLDTKYKTNETKGNFNNEIGLPLTLLGLNASHKALVVEMGMSQRGEISALSKIAEPDISVITGIGTSHIEHLGSREAIRDAKMEIVDGMKAGGILILNGDDPLLRDVQADDICKITVGIDNNGCVYKAENIRMFGDHTIFDVRMHDGDLLTDLRINVIGKHNIYNALIACVVGVLLGVPEEKIRYGLLNFTPAEMRQAIVEKDGFTVIEDCYNASPESMNAGLDVLCRTAENKNARAVAVLGDMLELGHVSESAHFDIGNQAARCGVSRLITFGKAASKIAAGAIAAGMDESAITVIEDTENAEDAAKIIRATLQKGDVVLFKASRAIALERVIQLL